MIDLQKLKNRNAIPKYKYVSDSIRKQPHAIEVFKKRRNIRPSEGHEMKQLKKSTSYKGKRSHSKGNDMNNYLNNEENSRPNER